MAADSVWWHLVYCDEHLIHASLLVWALDGAFLTKRGSNFNPFLEGDVTF